MDATYLGRGLVGIDIRRKGKELLVVILCDILGICEIALLIADRACA